MTSTFHNWFLNRIAFRLLPITLIFMISATSVAAPARGQIDQVAKMCTGPFCVQGYVFFFDGGQSYLGCTNASGQPDRFFRERYKRLELVEDLNRLANWMEINKEAKVDAHKRMWFGETAGEINTDRKAWSFYATKNGKSKVISEFDKQCLWVKKPKKIRQFVDDIEANFDDIKEQHFNVADPFK